MKKTDVAIVFQKDGSIYVELPKLDPVPDYVLTAVAISVMLVKENKSLIRLINKQKKIFREMEIKND